MKKRGDLGSFLTSPAFRGRLLLLGWIAALGGLLVKAAEVQLRDGAEWRAEAARQHRAQGAIPAPRGGILDRNGTPLAVSRELYRVSVAPHELRDPDAAASLLADVLGVSEAEARRVTHSDRRWVRFRDLHPPRVREALARVPGIHLEREIQRFHPHVAMAGDILGAVGDEVGAGGIEQAFDEHLRGDSGAQVVARDSNGRPIPGERWTVSPPRAGGEVVLTLDRDLQEIAREALDAAITETGARGGDLIVADPRTGEILAMMSLAAGSTPHLGGVHTPYEPGSTLKPFTVAGLLQLGHAVLEDSVDTGNGQWRVAGRTITDVSAVGKVTLAHALRVSSNVGIARLAEAYTPAEQYEVLRDFGFGMPTGIPLPGEASGTLRPPRSWSRQSAASLSIGYEIAVTPLQMVMAYAALANDGLMMEPRLVRELRAPDGRIVERFSPRPVRRVVTPEVAREVNRALVEAVEDGTGGRARLSTFTVAGKSGTSRATGANGRYEQGAYFASFVGFFPAEDPRLVVFVKLDRPRGAYYGGATAAPVTRATMEAILAARHPPIDRGALAAIARRNGDEAPAVDDEPARFISNPPSRTTALAPPPGGSPTAGEALRVPEVAGVPARVLVRRLHLMGVHVTWEGDGDATGAIPRPGSPIEVGDTVRILAGRGAGAPLGREP